MKTKKIQKKFYYETALFVSSIVLIILFYKNIWLLLAVLAILWIIGLLFWHKKNDIIFFIIAGIIASAAEIACINFGVWRYANATIAGIPIWLPFAWGFIAVFMKRVAETFTL